MTRWFGAPEWLALLPFVAFAAWWWPRLGWRSPLRLLCLALLVLVLSEPRLSSGGHGLDLWVLVDRSASVRDVLEPRRVEIESLLARAKPDGARISYVDYADQAIVRSAEGEALGGSLQLTRTATAIQFALGRMDTERPARLLLLTDGFSTEPLQGVGERLRDQGVPLDLRVLAPAAAVDYRADALLLPSRVQPLEPFMMEVRISGSSDGDVPLVIKRDEQVVGRAVASLHDGSAVVRFTDRIARGGAYRYAAELTQPDAFPGNNHTEAWVEVAAGSRVLLASVYPDDPVAAVLRAQGFDVELVTDLSSLGVGRLAGARAVVLDNVPAYALPPSFLAALDGFVRAQGGGLLMVGGKTSFAAGGYYGSPIDALLPVSMELRQEHRKLAVAMAIAMDRSGSMAANVAPQLTKMDLADEGAARSITLLGDHDGVAVIAVDSEPHHVVPLSEVGSGRARVIDIIRRIQSGGGGIYIGVALEAAWQELRGAPQGQRHVILFADAADSEEPGDYPRLVQEMVRGGCTVSVIGLGTERDSDAALLKDIARLGKGRIFFNADPASLPALFAQETVAVARSAFIKEPTRVSPAAGILEIAGKAVEGLDAVDGYNLSYLRPEATAAAFAQDEYKAPLIAFWQRGTGRVAAVSFPLGGEFSQRVRAWGHYGDLVQTLVRWLRGADAPAGIGLRSRLDGTTLRLDLRFDRAWEERLATSPPRILMAEGVSGDIRPLVWERLGPGHFESRAGLLSDRFYRGAVEVGGATLPFGPVEAPGGAEWAFDPARLQELRAVSAQSGGRERSDLAGVFEAPPEHAPRDLRPALLTLCLLLIVTEALRNRMGMAWRTPTSRTASSMSMAPPRPTASVGAIEAVSPPPQRRDSESTSEPGPDQRANRFRRAKEKGSRG